MYKRNRLGMVGAALVSLGILAGATAAPAGAATQPSAPVPRAGSILCNGDLCIQTVSVNTSNHTAKVNAWADTRTVTGYFILQQPPVNGIGSFEYSPTRTWPAGGTHYTFTTPLLHGTYWMFMYQGAPPGSPIGDVGFGINF